MTIGLKARAPKVASPRLRIVRASGKALTEGIERHRIEGVSVPIYSAAKTVADCFKYRRLVGLDVAIEALRECRRKRCASTDEIWRFAELGRVTNVMRPYLEALACRSRATSRLRSGSVSPIVRVVRPSTLC